MSTHRDPRVTLVTREVLKQLRARDSRPPRAAGSAGPITAMIDHTLLRPEATEADIERLTAEAKQHGFAAVCVNPVWVPLAARRLAGTRVKVATVVGFPLGAMHTEIKALEARRLRALGAHEIDMVLNQGELAAGRIADVAADIAAVRRAIGSETTLKVILETARLSESQVRQAAKAAVESGADFLKTSTGFGPGGATADAVRILREVAGTRVGVKASGGIRTLEEARAMVEAGATRIGASSGVDIAAAERR